MACLTTSARWGDTLEAARCFLPTWGIEEAQEVPEHRAVSLWLAGRASEGKEGQCRAAPGLRAAPHSAWLGVQAGTQLKATPTGLSWCWGAVHRCGGGSSGHTGGPEASQDCRPVWPCGVGGGSRRLEMAGGLGKKAHLGNVSDGERYSAGPACLPG